MKSPLVSCIVVTHNSEEYIESCLKALRQSTYPALEIIVVDNHSTDKTLVVVKKFSKHVTLYARAENDGYAGGHQFGMQKAQGEFFFLLNPDTTVTPDFLKPLVAMSLAHSKSAAVQPLVYLSSQPNVVNLTGKVPHYLGFDWLRDYQLTKVREAGRLSSFSGSGILLRKSAVQAVGGLDTNYFMYYEDGDLSWRLRLAGYELWFCPDSVVYHDYKFIPNEKYQPLKQKIFWAERNRVYTLLKNYALSTLVLLLPIFLVMELGILLYFTVKGWLPTKLKSYRSLWRVRHSLLARRRTVQQTRKVEDREVVKDFSKTIEFGLFDHPLVQHVLNPLLSLYWSLIWPLV